MIIRKKRISSIGNNLIGLKRGDHIIIAICHIERFIDRLKQIGFSANLELGETILPAAVGPVSKYNSEGTYEIHKDQPKETAYRQAEWTWREFRGRYDSIEKSKIVEIPYKRYPRTFIPPPSTELYIDQFEIGEKYLTSMAIDYKEENDQILLHIINLFLELFGECEIFGKGLAPLISNKMIRLNWKVLPQGKMPWAKLKSYLGPIIERQPEGNRPVIEKRHETINAYNPEFFAVGQGGFDGYVIFGFPSKSLFILESSQTNNATYVLDKNWEVLASLTKAELLSKELHKERLIHRKNWFTLVKGLLNS